jgi:hypothetical protein
MLLMPIEPRSHLVRGLPPVLLALLLVACEQPAEPPDRPHADGPSIDPQVRVLAAQDPRTVARCVESVIAVLRAHGFRVEPEGVPVAVEVELRPEPGYSLLSSQGAQKGSNQDRYTGIPQGQTTAEITATVGGAQPIRSGGTSAEDACAVATDRLAEGLAKAIASHH